VCLCQNWTWVEGWPGANGRGEGTRLEKQSYRPSGCGFGARAGGPFLCRRRDSMVYRVLPVFVAILAVALLAGAAVLAQDKPGRHEGKVVKVSGEKLTRTDRAGKNEHTHVIPATAKITANGKDAKLVDLKAGDLIKVTIEKKGDRNEVTKVEVD